jgi:hypothetical protein
METQQLARSSDFIFLEYIGIAGWDCDSGTADWS